MSKLNIFRSANKVNMLLFSPGGSVSVLLVMSSVIGSHCSGDGPAMMVTVVMSEGIFGSSFASGNDVLHT